MPKLTSKIFDQSYIIQLKCLEPPIVSVEGLVVRDDKQLSREMKISEKEVKRLKYQAALFSLQGDSATSNQLCHITADHLYRRSLREGQFILTGCSKIDQLLSGGLTLQLVTEVASLSSSGKTQFCMTTSALAACGGVRVLYIDTQNSCSPIRLREIISSRLGTIPAMEALRRIHIKNVYDSISLISYLYSVSSSQSKLPPELQYRFIVVDSMSSVFGSAIGRDASLFMHMSSLATVVSVLSFLAKTLNASVLVTNGMSVKRKGEGEMERRLPTLGRNWAFLPSVRLIFSRNNENEYSATLDKHPRTKCGMSVKFSISEYGVKD